MSQHDKTVSYTTQNTYLTLNELTEHTKNVWIVLHGIGYLSRYFIPYFNELDTDKNYIIAPQAPSKYYLKNAYKHVGASWLTKENTTLEIENVISYLDAVFEAENLPKSLNVIIFGFSQGVSVATRWVAHKQLKCGRLILYAGGIPKELTPDDFAFLEENNTKVTVLIGDQDEYISQERFKLEAERIEVLFKGRAEQIVFEGKHEIKKELLHQFVS